MNWGRAKEVSLSVFHVSLGRYILLALAFLALSPAQSVIPPPDGGYPRFNTAEGQNALLSLTWGSHNTAIGWYSLKSDTYAGYNMALRAGTLYANTADGNTGRKR